MGGARWSCLAGGLLVHLGGTLGGRRVTSLAVLRWHCSPPINLSSYLNLYCSSVQSMGPRAGVGPQASSVQVWHFPGQKLRLGGGALGADPTYLLYIPFRSYGGI